MVNLRKPKIENIIEVKDFLFKEIRKEKLP